MTVSYKTFTGLIGLIALTLATGCGTLHASGPSNVQGETASQGNTDSISMVKTVTQKWLQMNQNKKHVVLDLDVSANGQFDFDGYRNGFMTVTIPKGWVVEVRLKNRGLLPESAIVLSLTACDLKQNGNHVVKSHPLRTASANLS